MTNDLQPKRTVYSVTELNRTIRNLLESEFPLLWIEGEISNLAQPASGHIYLTLKDAGAQVRCAMFKGRKQFLRFKPQNGQKVLVRAKVGLYEARGDYQLIIEHMEEAGAGDLQRQFEELKERLAKEGLFDEAVKQLLPELPERIGIITSATGAAIRDVLSVLQR
ncbi:MAG: exodeoxyribonuclease VII large subunit, partial [Gammaproteobacteria bacterium]|nr:exodeoxyribonuclease VII large subunit [Gammaproteobacteria bacterium]